MQAGIGIFEQKKLNCCSSFHHILTDSVTEAYVLACFLDVSCTLEFALYRLVFGVAREAMDALFHVGNSSGGTGEVSRRL